MPTISKRRSWNGGPVPGTPKRISSTGVPVRRARSPVTSVVQWRDSGKRPNVNESPSTRTRRVPGAFCRAYSAVGSERELRT